MAECKLDRNKDLCGCSHMSCGKRGVRCDYLQSHWANGELPGCLFPPDVDKTYDRSVATFVQTYQERGPWW